MSNLLKIFCQLRFGTKLHTLAGSSVRQRAVIMIVSLLGSKLQANGPDLGLF